MTLDRVEPCYSGRVSKGSLVPAATRSHAWGRGVSIAFLCAGLLAAVGCAALGYVTYAVLVIAGLLLIFAGLRAALPGRPWFSSRNKLADTTVLLSLAMLMAYFSQYATIAAS